MPVIEDIKKTIDATPLFAAVGATDLAVEKVREARLRADKARADLAVRADKARTELSADLAPATVQARATQVADQVREIPALALNQTLVVGGKFAEGYEELAARGDKLVTRLQNQQSTKDLVAQADTAVALGKGAVTSARKAPPTSSAPPRPPHHRPQGGREGRRRRQPVRSPTRPPRSPRPRSPSRPSAPARRPSAPAPPPRTPPRRPRPRPRPRRPASARPPPPLRRPPPRAPTRSAPRSRPRPPRPASDLTPTCRLRPTTRHRVPPFPVTPPTTGAGSPGPGRSVSRHGCGPAPSQLRSPTSADAVRPSLADKVEPVPHQTTSTRTAPTPPALADAPVVAHYVTRGGFVESVHRAASR